jgi:hypothetical protein
MRATTFALIAAVGALAACGSRDSRARSRSADSSATAEAPLVRERPGETTITSTDGNIELALRADTVAMRLSKRVLDEADAKLDNKRSDSKLGAMIENVVKSAVKSGLSTEVSYRLDEIKDARYEDGAIRFDYVKRHDLSFENVKQDKRPVLEMFRPDDAERFVGLVNAAKSKR